MGRESVGGEGQRESGRKTRRPHRQGVMHRVKPSSRQSKRARPSVRRAAGACGRGKATSGSQRAGRLGVFEVPRLKLVAASETRPLDASKVVRAREGRGDETVTRAAPASPDPPVAGDSSALLPVPPAYLHCSVHPLTTCRWRATPLSLCQSPLLPLTGSLLPHISESRPDPPPRRPPWVKSSGGSRGIGLAIALKLAKEAGAKVTIAAKTCALSSSSSLLGPIATS